MSEPNWTHRILWVGWAVFVVVGLLAFDPGSAGQNIYAAAPFLAAPLLLVVDRIIGSPRR